MTNPFKSAQRIKDLENRLHDSEKQNLRLRLEIEILTDFPLTNTATKIMAKYRAKREAARLKNVTQN